MPPFVPNTSSVKFPISTSITLCSCVLALVGPVVNMRYTYVQKGRYSWCPKTSCLHIQPRLSTCNGGLKVEYVIVEWLQERLCLHISAQFTDV